MFPPKFSFFRVFRLQREVGRWASLFPLKFSSTRLLSLPFYFFKRQSEFQFFFTHQRKKANQFLGEFLRAHCWKDPKVWGVANFQFALKGIGDHFHSSRYLWAMSVCLSFVRNLRKGRKETTKWQSNEPAFSGKHPSFPSSQIQTFFLENASHDLKISWNFKFDLSLLCNLSYWWKRMCSDDWMKEREFGRSHFRSCIRTIREKKKKVTCEVNDNKKVQSHWVSLQIKVCEGYELSSWRRKCDNEIMANIQFLQERKWT